MNPLILIVIMVFANLGICFLTIHPINKFAGWSLLFNATTFLLVCLVREIRREKLP